MSLQVNSISCILFQITVSTTFCSRRLVVHHKVHMQWAHLINLQRHDSQPFLHDDEARHHWHWPSCCGNQSWQCHYVSPGHEIIKEEADTMIVQQVADVRPTKALIVVDDTDVFCVVSSFLLQRKHTSTSLIFCHNHINGFTHSWLPLLISIVIYQIFYQHLG